MEHHGGSRGALALGLAVAAGLIGHGLVGLSVGDARPALADPAPLRDPAAGGESAPATPLSDTLTTAQRRAIDAFIAGTMDELDLVPGLAVAIVMDEAIVYENGLGWANVERREPVSAGTIFYTASLSKALTGMAAAVLAAQGRLDLDAPITTWYSGLDFPAPLAPAESTTLRHLLTHTPRFLNSGVNFYPTFVGRYSDEELVRVLNGYSIPNDGFQYSNMSYALVSEILGKAGGAPWQDVIAEAVFEPLGMRSTTVRASRTPIRGVAAPYTRTTAGFEVQTPLKTDAKITGAGGFFASAHDLARYVIANLNEGRVDGRQALPAAAVREAQRPQADVEARFFEFDRRAYGLGLYVADYDGDSLVHHFGGISGGFRSHMSWMPEHEIGVVALQNSAGAASSLPDIVATYVYDLLLGRSDVEERARARLDTVLAGAPDALEAITRLAARRDSAAAAGHTPALDAGAYAGTYENERIGRARIVPGADGLRVQWGEIDTPFVPLGENDFLVEWQRGYPPATWTFVVEDDEITRFEWDGRVFRRVR
jgi:CubicO group peptidase (beta-lactamase class C family)